MDPLDALPRIALAHLPTPIVQIPQLSARLGCELFVKRDDVTGGAESGNKLRKLEFLMAEALDQGCDTVLTTGGIQSNHARATALVCARLGLACVLFLRVDDPFAPLPLTGNVLLDALAGATIRPITREQYRTRDELMAAAARELRLAGKKPYVVPEGGSNGLGSLGYVRAMREVRAQIDCGLAGDPRPFDVVVHACGSGGTAAGIALGAARYGVARAVRPMAVCDSADYFQRRVEAQMHEARARCGGLPTSPPFVVDDAGKGPAYAVTTTEQRAFLVDVARTSGVVLDPVYTGKAMFGLGLAIKRGDVPAGARVLFVHTGGLPGLLAAAESFHEEAR